MAEQAEVNVKGNVVDIYFAGHRVMLTMTPTGPVMRHNSPEKGVPTGVYPLTEAATPTRRNAAPR